MPKGKLLNLEEEAYKEERLDIVDDYEWVDDGEFEDDTVSAAREARLKRQAELAAAAAAEQKDGFEVQSFRKLKVAVSGKPKEEAPANYTAENPFDFLESEDEDQDEDDNENEDEEEQEEEEEDVPVPAHSNRDTDEWELVDDSRQASEDGKDDDSLFIVDTDSEGDERKSQASKRSSAYQKHKTLKGGKRKGSQRWKAKKSQPKHNVSQPPLAQESKGANDAPAQMADPNAQQPEEAEDDNDGFKPVRRQRRRNRTQDHGLREMEVQLAAAMDVAPVHPRQLVLREMHEQQQLVARAVRFEGPSSKANPSTFAHKEKEAYNAQVSAERHHRGLGGGGSHYHMAGSKQFLKGVRVKGVVARHSRQAAKRNGALDRGHAD